MQKPETQTSDQIDPFYHFPLSNVLVGLGSHPHLNFEELGYRG